MHDGSIVGTLGDVTRELAGEVLLERPSQAKALGHDADNGRRGGAHFHGPADERRIAREPCRAETPADDHGQRLGRSFIPQGERPADERAIPISVNALAVISAPRTGSTW